MTDMIALGRQLADLDRRINNALAKHGLSQRILRGRRAMRSASLQLKLCTRQINQTTMTFRQAAERVRALGKALNQVKTSGVTEG